MVCRLIFQAERGENWTCTSAFAGLARQTILVMKPRAGLSFLFSLWLSKGMVWVERGPACQGGSHVAHLNFITTRVGVYKCLSLIVGFAVTVAIWPREVVSCRDFILRAVATSVGPCHLSEFTLARPPETHQELTEAGDRGNINFCHECV